MRNREELRLRLLSGQLDQGIGAELAAAIAATIAAANEPILTPAAAIAATNASVVAGGMRRGVKRYKQFWCHCGTYGNLLSLLYINREGLDGPGCALLLAVSMASTGTMLYIMLFQLPRCPSCVVFLPVQITISLLDLYMVREFLWLFLIVWIQLQLMPAVILLAFDN